MDGFSGPAHRLYGLLFLGFTPGPVLRREGEPIDILDFAKNSCQLVGEPTMKHCVIGFVLLGVACNLPMHTNSACGGYRGGHSEEHQLTIKQMEYRASLVLAFPGGQDLVLRAEHNAFWTLECVSRTTLILNMYTAESPGPVVELLKRKPYLLRHMQLTYDDTGRLLEVREGVVPGYTYQTKMAADGSWQVRRLPDGPWQPIEY